MPDQIGRFGVGFKSVFVYTRTPIIHSGDFAFKIVRLVLPEPVDRHPTIGNRTRFWLPFGNHPGKTPDQAFAEVKAGLDGLAQTTLLFLRNLRSIRWQIGQASAGAVVRMEYPERSESEGHHPARSQAGRHIEVVKEIDGTVIGHSHFLRYDQPVDGLDNRWVAIAFDLAFLPDAQTFEPARPLNEQMKIVPSLHGQAPGGRVAVFFPAEREQSGLCFHLHAPFVPELSRASVKDTRANDPLFAQLATLAASVLHDIRARGLLTGEFLAVLPNQLDPIRSSYQPIRAAIVQEMKNEPLTPTHAGTYAPARCLLQAKAAFKDLLSEEDLDFVVPHEGQPPRWVIGATQRNRRSIDFLAALEIPEWDVKKLVDVLTERASEARRWLPSPPHFVDEPDPEFMRWLGGKPPQWHQDLYAMLITDYLESAGWQKAQFAEKLKPLRIVRLSNGDHSAGGKCYFPSADVQPDALMPRVDPATYASGKSKTQQENARRFLERIGVREVGLAELVEKILEVCYCANSLMLDEEHLKFFVDLIESQPDKAELFSRHFIFKRDDGTWGMPSQVFLDAPFLETGLRAYYDGLGDRARRRALAADYRECGIPFERLVSFAKAVGVQIALEVTRSPCLCNPDWERLGSGQVRKASNDRYKRISSDYQVSEFLQLAAAQSAAASRLIWSTMINVVKPEHLIAIYKHNNQSPLQRGDSQLVHRLVAASWVPQLDGRFVRPADAVRELLPAGFPFDPGWPWIQAIRFGSNAPKESQEHAAAKALGFADVQSLELDKWFASLPPEARDQIRADWGSREAIDLPDRKSPNPEHRVAQVEKDAVNAPVPITERRPRPVPLGLDEVKEEARQYLRDRYTNADGDMICQVCRAPLPFKLDDGSHFFEAVKLLRELDRWHRQNYLALCPNHAAMFLYANPSRDNMKALFAEMTGNELPIVLAQKNATIYFTTIHRDDLRAVIRADRELGGGERDTA